MIFLLLLACSEKNEDTYLEEEAEFVIPQPEPPAQEEETEQEEELPVEEEDSPPEEETLEEEYSCDEGRVYWKECTGVPVAPSLVCTENLYNELSLAQALTCDEFLQAQDRLPLCDTLGINCPEDYQGCADSALDAGDVLAVLEWTDLSTLTTIYDVEARNECICCKRVETLCCLLSND